MNILRMDDPGAATKQYEQYAKVRARVAGVRVPTPGILNWGGLKRLPGVAGWGPYSELSVDDWWGIFDLLREYEAKLVVAVTAGWVEESREITPFGKKFPEQVEGLKGAVYEGLVEIANHGLTHCVLEDDAYLPKRFESNRKYHREFWEWVPEEVHKDHMGKSQEILQGLFGEVVTFVPPGNVWTESTERAAASVGIKYLNAPARFLPDVGERNGIKFVPEDNVRLFHDREIALQGIGWLKKLLLETTGPYVTIRGYCEDAIN